MGTISDVFHVDIDLTRSQIKIVDAIKKIPAEELSGAERISQLEKEALKDNIFALYELYNCYQNGKYITPDNETAISFLLKITEIPMVGSINSTVWDEGGILPGAFNDRPGVRLDLLYVEEWFLSSTIGDTYAKLGYYYKNNDEKASFAEYCFWIAILHGFNCLDDRKEVQDRINRKTTNKNNTTLKMLDASSNECPFIQEELITDFTAENWNKLKPESHLSLVTGVFCYKKFDSLSTKDKKFIDFSAAVIPFMKVLEAELSSRFWIKYNKYIRRTYPNPNDFAKKNNITEVSDYDNHNMIIYKNRVGTVKYVSRTPLFTLGNFEYTYGMPGNDPKTLPDNTAVEFCIRELFKPVHAKEKDATDWLLKLRNDILALKKIRNDAAHGGKTISQEDAEICINEILLIKKILKNILDHCRY